MNLRSEQRRMRRLLGPEALELIQVLISYGSKFQDAG